MDLTTPLFDRLISRPRHPWVTAGASLLLLLAPFGADVTDFWLQLYLTLSSGLMYGLLAWTIYAAVAGTRLTAALHRQPLRVDLFDTTPFEAIGRQSLLLALVFVGGITLSLVFVVFQPESLHLLEFWLVYIPLSLVPVTVFFLNMRPTHQVLSAAKKRELEAVQRHLVHRCRTLAQRLDESQDTGTLAAEVNALVAYEQRIQGARSWPYNLSMLRTLFLSVLVPAGTMLARVIADVSLR